MEEVVAGGGSPLRDVTGKTGSAERKAVKVTKDARGRRKFSNDLD